MRSRLSRTILFVLAVCQSMPAQSPNTDLVQRVEQGLLPPVLVKGDSGWAIEERMRHYMVPAVSIAVIRDFKVEWAKGYGVKDLESREPATTETLFQAGSISKPVAAMVALKKVQDGKIALDQNINEKLTSWKLPDNEFTAKRKVTLANLLSHTGGLTVHGFPGYEVGEKLPTVPQVLDGAELTNTPPVRVDMEPGTHFRYSGGGVTIAQLAIMDLEKKPYAQIAQETVLGPLNMSHSTYSQPLPDDIRRQAASGYRSNGKVVEGRFHVYPEMAAAGLWTTPTDLAKFAIEVQLSLAGKSNKVLSKGTTAKMVTPFIEDFIGMGFFIEKHGSATYFGHGGADEGFRAGLLVSRDKGYGAAIMVNSDNGDIIDEIMRSIAREYQWEGYLPIPREVVSVDPEKLDGYTGRFLVDPDRVLTLTREGGRLFGDPQQSPKFELFPVSDSEFIRKDANLRYVFHSTGGKVDSFQVNSEQGTTVAPRISNDTMIPFELLMAGRATEAVAAYKTLKTQKPDSVAVSERRLNNLAYSLIQRNKLVEAIAVLKVNAELYPQSANVYDSLGEAYLASGDKELAIQNYKRSIELDPRNRNASNMLRKLGQ